MTDNPQCLLDGREVLLDNLPGLTANALGIKGDTSHVVQGDSYHLGLPQQDRDGYSVRESPRDRAGLDRWACALDIGWFEWRNPKTGQVHNLRTFSRWLVDQLQRGNTLGQHIREVIYSLDGKTVKRWDRLGRRGTGDSSHRNHTHISFFRDAVKAGKDVIRSLLIQYLQSIGRLATPEAAPEGPKIRKRDQMETRFVQGPDRTVYLSEVVIKDGTSTRTRTPLTSMEGQVNENRQKGYGYFVAETAAQLDSLAGKPTT